MLNLFTTIVEGWKLNFSQGIQTTNVSTDEEFLHLNNLAYEIDIMDGKIKSEIASQGVQNFKTSVQFLRYNNLFCQLTKNNAVFRRLVARRVTLFQLTTNLERSLGSEELKIVYPKNVYQIRLTFSGSLNSFGTKYTIEETMFRNIAKFDCDSTCVQQKSFKDTETKKRIGKHVPILVSISLNLVEQSIFNFFNSDPHHRSP